MGWIVWRVPAGVCLRILWVCLVIGEGTFPDLRGSLAIYDFGVFSAHSQV